MKGPKARSAYICKQLATGNGINLIEEELRLINSQVWMTSSFMTFSGKVDSDMEIIAVNSFIG